MAAEKYSTRFKPQDSSAPLFRPMIAIKKVSIKPYYAIKIGPNASPANQ